MRSSGCATTAWASRASGKRQGAEPWKVFSI
jgi:hypothetical protein